MDRIGMLKIISRRLIGFIALSLLFTGACFVATFSYGQHFMLSWFAFECGMIGGFVSIEQRIKDVEDKELQLLSSSWPCLLIAPIFGGIFAMLLYVIFLAKVVDSALFPSYYIPGFSSPPGTKDLAKFFLETYPASPEDFAKHSFWSFVAGFSERFVLKIVTGVAGKAEDQAGGAKPT
jgi:hypothetical protein